MNDSTIDSQARLHPYARFRIDGATLDRMPVGTILISASTPETHSLPETAMRLVKPNDVSKYPSAKLTPGGRLLYYFWNHKEGAVKKLGMASTGKTWRWIIMPGDPEFDTIDGFKILCDHRCGNLVPTTLLRKALGYPE